VENITKQINFITKPFLKNSPIKIKYNMFDFQYKITTILLDKIVRKVQIEHPKQQCQTIKKIISSKAPWQLSCTKKRHVSFAKNIKEQLETSREK
jgi:hypothetical protein